MEALWRRYSRFGPPMTACALTIRVASEKRPENFVRRCAARAPPTALESRLPSVRKTANHGRRRRRQHRGPVLQNLNAREARGPNGARACVGAYWTC